MSVRLSRQILYHILNRFYFLGAAGIGAAEKQCLIKNSFRCVGQGLRNAVRNAGRITVLQTLIAVRNLCIFSLGLSFLYLLQKMVPDCSSAFPPDSA